jgi:hypothetical protein
MAEACPATGAKQPIGPSTRSFLGALGIDILASIGSQIATGLLDEVANALTADGGIAIDARVPVDDFLSQAAKDGPVSFSKKVFCIWVAIAEEFTAANPPSNPAVIVPFVPPDGFAAQERVAKTTGASTPVLLYFEAEILASHDKTAWTLVPDYWYFPKFLAPGGFFQQPNRDVRIAFEWSTPDKPAQPFASTELKWIGVGEGTVSLARVQNSVLPWMPGPSYTAPKQPSDFFPVNVRVQFAETTHPYKLATYIGRALAAKKEAVGTAVSGAIEQSLSEQARIAARSQLYAAANTALGTYKSAYDAAKKAYDDWNAATGTAKPGLLTTACLAYAQLRNAQAAAQGAFASADLPFAALPDLPALSC